MVALYLVKGPNKRRQTPEQVSELTTNRLSVYLRCLNELDASGVQTISSQGLAEQFHLNAAQIRKDLAYFGEFGVRGVGYYVRDLKRHLRQILGLDRKLRVAIMASGIKAVLNFSPGALKVPPEVKLKSVDLTVSLESLSFFLAQGEDGQSEA